MLRTIASPQATPRSIVGGIDRLFYSSSIGGCHPTETQALRTLTEIGLLSRNAITVARPQAVPKFESHPPPKQNDATIFDHED